MGPRLRVFISSVIDGFTPFRTAAAEGVEAAGAEPVMVERFPSLAKSSRNACLDGVQSSDVCLVLVGERGGWPTPSGALAVEEEFEEARRRALPVLVFLKEGDRDEQANRLARRLSDYVSGGFRKTFKTPDDLRAQVSAAVAELGSHVTLPRSDPKRVMALLESEDGAAYEASVRLVLVPERSDELLAPERLASRQLIQELYSIAHETRFFDYECAKAHQLTPDGMLLLRQDSPRQRARLSAGLSISGLGEVAIEADITADGEGDTIQRLFVLLETDLTAALVRGFALAAGLYDLLDPHERFASFWTGAAILGAGNRYLVPGAPKGNSWSMRMVDKGPTVAEKAPRRIARAGLREPGSEVDRLLALFRRQLGPRDDA